MSDHLWSQKLTTPFDVPEYTVIGFIETDISVKYMEKLQLFAENRFKVFKRCKSLL